MKEDLTKVIDTLTQEDFDAAFQKFLERYNNYVTNGGDYFEGDKSFICVLSIKVPIRKKKKAATYRKLLVYIYIYIYIYIYCYSLIFQWLIVNCQRRVFLLYELPTREQIVFYGMSTFIGYFMLKQFLLKYTSATIYPIVGCDKKVKAFLKGIRPNVNTLTHCTTRIFLISIYLSTYIYIYLEVTLLAHIYLNLSFSLSLSLSLVDR